MFTIDWEEKGAYIKFNSAIDIYNIIEAEGKIYGDSRFEHVDYLLYDFTDIDSSQLKQKDVIIPVTLDKNASRWNSSLKLAIIAQDAHFIDLASQYIQQMMSSSWDFSLFETEAQARDWVLVGKGVQ